MGLYNNFDEETGANVLWKKREPECCAESQFSEKSWDSRMSFIVTLENAIPEGRHRFLEQVKSILVNVEARWK